MGLGCWALAAKDWGEQSDSRSRATLETAATRNILHWDTALAYGGGRSERLCGEFMRHRRARFFLATKASLGQRPDGLIRSLKRSLDNLKVAEIDLFYIHWPRRNIDMRPAMELLEKERERGTIRAVGVSNFSVPQMEHLLEAGSIDAAQFGYNLVWRHAERELIPFCSNRGIAVVAYGSLAEGILTGKFSRRPNFAPGDHRPHTIYFRPQVWPRLYDAVQAIKSLAQTSTCRPGQLALQWLDRQSEVAVFLAGARSARQLEENAAWHQSPASEETMSKLQAISDQIKDLMPDEENIFAYYP